jgi:D-tyrosyl-tRNA(Tyr) deacylase
MILVIQRVLRAEVVVRERNYRAEIGKGLLVLVGVEKGDGEKDVQLAARKLPELRIFDDEEGKMNLSLMDVGGEILLISQFTLAGSVRKGRRPSMTNAAPPEDAERLFEELKRSLSERVPVKTGVFRTYMEVTSTNAGPVTFILNTREPRSATK